MYTQHTVYFQLSYAKLQCNTFNVVMFLSMNLLFLQNSTFTDIEGMCMCMCVSVSVCDVCV